MLPSTPSDKFCVPFSDKLHVSSLVMSPTTQSLHCPGLEAIPHEHPQHQDHGPYSGASFGHEITSTTKEKSPVNQPKVLGLPVKVFWVVMVGLVVILAGGIGGGLAGGLAASHQPRYANPGWQSIR